MSFPAEKTEKYDNLVHELVASRLIVKICTSRFSCVYTYIKKQYFVGAKNYSSTIFDVIALTTFFGANSERNDGCKGGNKEVDKPDVIVSLHLAGNNC